MVMDRAYPEETINKHHMPGLDLESSGEEKERPTKEHLEKRPGGGRQADWLHLERVGANPLDLGCWGTVVDGLCPSRGSRPK